MNALVRGTLPTVLVMLAFIVVGLTAGPPRGSGHRPTLPTASRAGRIAIPALGIDLPVIGRDVRVPGQGPGRYPPCDVAILHTGFGEPGDGSPIYVYAHARTGMFLPLLEASLIDDGAGLVGQRVLLFRDDGTVFEYAITIVKRHATDFSLAFDGPADAQRLVLQTSEGPAGTVPKLQIAADLAGTDAVDVAEAVPPARPRTCYGAG